LSAWPWVLQSFETNRRLQRGPVPVNSSYGVSRIPGVSARAGALRLLTATPPGSPGGASRQGSLHRFPSFPKSLAFGTRSPGPWPVWRVCTDGLLAGSDHPRWLSWILRCPSLLEIPIGVPIPYAFWAVALVSLDDGIADSIEIRREVSLTICDRGTPFQSLPRSDRYRSPGPWPSCGCSYRRSQRPPSLRFRASFPEPRSTRRLESPDGSSRRVSL